MVICLCFPGGTAVTTKDGVKKIQDLQPLDKVLTAGKYATKQKWTTFVTYGHLEANKIAEFIVIEAENGKELIISSDHLLFIAGKNGRVAKKAGQVSPGDKLYHLNSHAVMQLVSVVDIKVTKMTGVYAPFTMTGDFLANGFLVGCYANVDNFAMAHAALAPLRAWYKLVNHKLGNESQEEGIHSYALKLMKIRELLPFKFNSEQTV